MISEPRTVQSKKYRLALWEYYEGKCQICGQSVIDFEVDHIIPVARGGTTGIFNLQLLCRSCNRQKGTKMITLRSFQDTAGTVARRIRAGELPDLKQIIADVTPGGGKSTLPVIFGAELIGAKIDKIVWVVPRQSLQKQGELAFTNLNFRAIFQHQHKIRIATNDLDPARGLAGYVTTYQAIGQDPKLNLREFRRYGRILLVLDEFHHIEEDGSTWAAIQPLMNHATLTLMMTGTLERGDKGFIGPIEYDEISKNHWVPILEDSDHQLLITYSRRQALQECAIIPMDFEHSDASTSFLDSKNERQDVDSIAELTQPNAAIFSALSTEYASHLLKRGFKHWVAYRQQHPRSKMLVVAPRVALARRYLKYIKDTLRIDRCGLAVSQDGPEAIAAIEAFREKDGKQRDGLDVLVTVGMAYEGLDVPQITHVICLTHIRSKPWIHQMLSRAVRVDSLAGAYETQRAFCFGPDDRLFHECIKEILEDQVGYARETIPDDGPGGDGPGLIIPISSAETQVQAQTDNIKVDYQMTESIQTLMTRQGIAGVSTVQMFKVIQEFQSQTQPQPARDTAAPREELTPSQEQARLLEAIEDHNRSWIGKNKNEYEWDHINREIKIRFGKGRPDMSLEELRAAWLFVATNYPL